MAASWQSAWFRASRCYSAVLLGVRRLGFVLLFPVPAVRAFYELDLPHGYLGITMLIAFLGSAALVGFWLLSSPVSAAPPAE